MTCDHQERPWSGTRVAEELAEQFWVLRRVTKDSVANRRVQIQHTPLRFLYVSVAQLQTYFGNAMTHGSLSMENAIL